MKSTVAEGCDIWLARLTGITVGGRVGDEMILDRTVTRTDGSTVRQRMRWWDIASDTFSWD